MGKTWIIYLHRNKINGMCYVGLTNQTTAQRWGHDGGGYKGQKFYEAIEEFGWENFEHTILEDNIKTIVDADIAERKWIAYYNSYENGYNQNPGGGGSYYFSQETRQKMSESSKKRWQDPNYRKFMSEMHSKANSKPVKCIDTGIIYESAKEAAIATGDPSGNQGKSIGQVCNGKREFANGFRWEWVDYPKEKRNNIDGLYFVLNGRFKIGKEKLKEDIINNGGKVRDKISSKTDYLINSSLCEGSKIIDAQRLGVKIITEEEYLKMKE